MYPYYNQQFYPATQQMYQQQPTQFNNVRPSLPGRIVNDISEVTPQEVPMDGSISFFPKADYSCIYAKAWDSNGMIRNFKFVPEADTEPEKGPNDIMTNICDRLNKIESMLALLTE